LVLLFAFFALTTPLRAGDRFCHDLNYDTARAWCDDGWRPSFKLTFSMPAESPLILDADPQGYVHRFRGTAEGLEIFRQYFLVNPVSNTVYGPPGIREWRDPYGYAYGVGDSVRFRRGDGYVIAAGSDSTLEKRGIPFSLGMDFRPVGPVWFRLDWQRSRESVLIFHSFYEDLRVENVAAPVWAYGPNRPYWEVDLTRHRTERTNEHKVRSDRVGISVRWDLLHNDPRFSFMPEAGGTVFLVRHREWEQWKDFDYDRFLPEARGQDPADWRHEVRASDQALVNYTTSLQWHAGVTGEVYPWSKFNGPGLGVSFRYYGNDPKATAIRQTHFFAGDDVIPIRARGWELSASAILAF